MGVRAAALEFISITDGTGARRELLRYPRRVVSLSPTITQTLSDLGLDDELVGNGKGGGQPRGERVRGLERPQVSKDLDLQRVADLMPDLVLADLEHNRAEDLEKLGSKVPLFVVHVKTVEEAVANLETLGILVDREEQAAALVQEIRAEQTVSKLWARGRPRIRTACLVSKDPFAALSGQTYASDFLALHGLDNVFPAKGEPVQAIELADLVSASPALVLLASDPFRFRPKHREEMLELSDVPACRDGHVVLVDGSQMLSAGSRMRRAFAQMREIVDKLAAPAAG